MIGIEKHRVNDVMVNTRKAGYLFNNQRVLNTVYAPAIRQRYYILQIADYDVEVITPFTLKQNEFGSCPEVVLVCYPFGHGFPNS